MKTKAICQDVVKTTGLFVLSALAVFWVLTGPASARAENWDHGNEWREDFYLQAERDTVDVTLSGVADYEVTEIFNDILVRTPGVVEAKRIRLHLDPDRPASCFVNWRVKIADTGLFELESAIYRMLRETSDGTSGSRAIAFNFAPEKKELELLGYIRPFQSTSRQIQFVMDRPLPPVRKHANKNYRGRGSWDRHAWGQRGFE